MNVRTHFPRAATSLLAFLLACNQPGGETPAADAAEPAADPAATETSAPSSEDALYFLGAAMSRNLGEMQLTEDEMETVIRGLRDGIAGNAELGDERASAQALQTFRSERKKVAAEKERLASTAFLSEAEGEDGAVTLESGLIFSEMTAGTGESPAATDRVRVHYHGRLRDGTVFDSSVDRGRPFDIALNRVIPCWTEGLQKMKVGGKARLVCPASIAYQDRGAPPKIPGGAALDFEVELIEILPPDATPGAAQ